MRTEQRSCGTPRRFAGNQSEESNQGVRDYRYIYAHLAWGRCHVTEHYGRHATPTVTLIRELAAQRKVILSRHAGQRMLQRGISTGELVAVLALRGCAVMRCYRCGGPVQEEKVRFTLTVVDDLVVVEGVPAHVCRQCGEQTFDLEVVKQLEAIRDRVMHGDLRPVQKPVGNLTFALSLA